MHAINCSIYIYTKVLTDVHIQISDQRLRKARDRRSPITYERTYDRSPLLTIDALILTIGSTIDTFTYDRHLYSRSTPLLTYDRRSPLLTRAKAWNMITICHSYQLHVKPSVTRLTNN